MCRTFESSTVSSRRSLRCEVALVLPSSLPPSPSYRLPMLVDRRAPVEGSVRPGASSRYEIVPSKFRLEPGEHKVFKVKLKVLRFPNTRKGIQGQRDVFHIKSSFFEQMFHSTMYLRASDGSGGEQRREARNLRLRARPSGSRASSPNAPRAPGPRRPLREDGGQDQGR